MNPPADTAGGHDKNPTMRWAAEFIDRVECKPEGGQPNVAVRVGWAAWRQAGRANPAATTWEPLGALGLSWPDVRGLIRPGTRLAAPPAGLTREERTAVATVGRLLGLRRAGGRAGGRASKGGGKNRTASTGRSKAKTSRGGAARPDMKGLRKASARPACERRVPTGATRTEGRWNAIQGETATTT